MTKSEFIDKIDNGNDIMFDVMNRHYTILTWTDKGIAIGEQYPNDGDLQYFDTSEELIDGFIVNGKPLVSFVQQIVITQYT